MQIFLSGAMSGCPRVFYNGWRSYVKNALKYDCVVINPVEKYDLGAPVA